MFFKCIVCKKRKNEKKEKTRWIKHRSKLRYDGKHSSIHLSCLEQVIQDPENYSLQLLDDCVAIAYNLREQMQQRHELREQLIKNSQELNMELFLDKAKGLDLVDTTDVKIKQIQEIDDEHPLCEDL